MKITKPLNNILDGEAKIKVLRFLCTTGAEWNGRQIAKETGMTPATAHKALYGLNKEGVLLLRNVGKTHIYCLNGDSFIVTDILKPLFAKERKVLVSIIDIIKRAVSSSGIKRDIISIALFGSVNVQKDHAMSDIDVIVIVKNAKVKPKAEKLFEEIDQKISKRFGNILSPYINTRSEFKSKYSKKMAVIKKILKEHTMIYGEKLETST